MEGVVVGAGFCRCGVANAGGGGGALDDSGGLVHEVLLDALARAAVMFQ